MDIEKLRENKNKAREKILKCTDKKKLPKLIDKFEDAVVDIMIGVVGG